VELRIAEALDEHDSGDWAGMSFRELSGDPRWRAWNTRREMTKPPHGESMRALQKRMIALLRRLAHERPQAEFVLVSHGEPIRAALLALNGVAIRDFTTIEVPAASVTSVSVLSGRRHGASSGLEVA
jgi:probable phosphoglycerate mutase